MREKDEETAEAGPVELPIDGILDLHTFLPGEVKPLLTDYFEACREKGIVSVRVIHGKGTGRLKKRVLSILSVHPLVARYYPAPESAGGWGATCVDLIPASKA